MSDLLGIFVNNLLPILLISGCGFLLARYLHLEPRSLGRIIFYVLYPVLVLDLLMRNHLSVEAILKTSGYTTLLLLVCGILAWLAGRLLKLERPALVSVILTSVFANCGNYGLPLISFAFGQDALAYGTIFYITTAILFNTAGVLIASMGQMTFKQAFLGLIKVPTIYGILVAVVLIQTGWKLPLPVERTVSLLSGAAIPSMLLLLGMELQRAQWTKNIKAVSISTGIRLVIGPLLGLVLTGLFGLQGPARMAAVVEASMPAAVMNTVLASEYQLDAPLVTSIVFVSTLLSPLTLTPLLFLLGK